jgi:hypothetical protein
MPPVFRTEHKSTSRAESGNRGRDIYDYQSMKGNGEQSLLAKNEKSFQKTSFFMD